MKTLKEYINESEQFPALFWIESDSPLPPDKIDDVYATFYWHAFPIENNIESLLEEYADEIGEKQSSIISNLINKYPEKMDNLTFYYGYQRAGGVVFGIVGNKMKKNDDKFPIFALVIRPNELGDTLKKNLSTYNSFMKRWCK